MKFLKPTLSRKAGLFRSLMLVVDLSFFAQGSFNKYLWSLMTIRLISIFDLIAENVCLKKSTVFELYS